MLSNKFKLWFCLTVLCIFPFSTAFAEIKVFEKEVEEIVGRDQSQEQVESFALQKAKRLAVEEAGTYISSLTVVQNYQLAKDEITALASGVVQAKIVGVPSVRLQNGVIHIRVKARIRVDTSILDRQIEEIMKEKGALKRLEEERKKVKELENKLAALKSSELKRLEELNAQAIALEKEREKRRLILEEQSLKARGELKMAEIERLQKEREMQSRISQIISEQEKARKEEAEALAKEQDRIRRAQLENEQRWNELIRKSQLSQTEWVSIDDSLSIKQAIDEVKQLKDEIANLNQRMDFQFEGNKKNLKKAFNQQIALMLPQLPPDSAEKDPFETTDEYNERLANHAAKVKALKAQNQKKIEKLKAEENLRIIQAKARYLEQKGAVLEPFVKRCQSLQEKKFLLPEGKMTITLGDPNADKSHFPLELQYKDQKWRAHWRYTDRNKAKDFWKTRTYLKAQGLFQLEEKNGVVFSLTSCRVSHLGTEESRDFLLKRPQTFYEITDWGKIKDDLPEIKKKEKWAAFLYETGGIYRDPWTKMEFILVKRGTLQMGSSSGRSNEEPVKAISVGHFLIGKYEVTQRQWKVVMRNNPSGFKGDELPVENVSWNDVQKFINRLNQREGADKYRLPKEAEWEYACRAGSTTTFCYGSNESSLGEYAWYSKNSGRRTQPIGQKKPNALGLYDMHGNVWEWCQDRHDKHCVVRGGSWLHPAWHCRSANRRWDYPGYHLDSIGFRVARDF